MRRRTRRNLSRVVGDAYDATATGRKPHPDMRTFTCEEPTESFMWIFKDRSGGFSEYPTSVAEYHAYVAKYGVPADTHWRPMEAAPPKPKKRRHT